MRAQITFDTLEYMDELKRSGMKQVEAEAITKATQKALSNLIDTKELVTKSDINVLNIEIGMVKNEIYKLKSDLVKMISDNTWKIIGILVTFQTLIISIFTLLNYLSK